MMFLSPLSHDVYFLQFIRFATACSDVKDFNNRKPILTAKLLKQGFQYYKLRKAFPKLLIISQILGIDR